jgi:hypothetical protein
VLDELHIGLLFMMGCSVPFGGWGELYRLSGNPELKKVARRGREFPREEHRSIFPPWQGVEDFDALENINVSVFISVLYIE